MRIFDKFDSWIKWHQQGKPLDKPIVIEPGLLIVQKDGSFMIKDWMLDIGWMNKDDISVTDLWEYLSLRYPEIIWWESKVNGEEWEKI